MNIYQIFILFFIYSFLGWIIEVLGKLIDKGEFINRGFLIGPYCPIYGFGALFMTNLLRNYSDDLLSIFILSALIAAILEYFTSYIFEKIFKARWWDYSKRKYNINGRICLETMVLFGIAGIIIIYITNPLILNIFNYFSNNALKIISLTLFIILLIDNIITFNIMFKIKEISKNLKTKKSDDTEKITKQVRKIIEKNNKVLQKRIINAFPHLEILNNKIIKTKNSIKNKTKLKK